MHQYKIPNETIIALLKKNDNNDDTLMRCLKSTLNAQFYAQIEKELTKENLVITTENKSLGGLIGISSSDTKSLGLGSLESSENDLGRISSQSPSSITSPSPVVSMGSLDKSLIQSVIKNNFNQIRYCYHKELAKNPSLTGKVNVQFTIASNGSVSNATIKESTFGEKGTMVESCLTTRFTRFTFPKPDSGIVIVNYPLVFQKN